MLQLLWVNMIMDTLGALALATEDPHPELLLHKPYGRATKLITGIMWKHILVQAMYQLGILFFMYYGFPVLWSSRYGFQGKGTYYAAQCMNVVNVNPIKDRQYICDVINVCGFPFGDSVSANSGLCPLHKLVWGATPTPVNLKVAVCGGLSKPGGNDPGMPECDSFKTARSAQKSLEKAYERQLDLEYRPILSLMFNTFVFCQVRS